MTLRTATFDRDDLVLGNLLAQDAVGGTYRGPTGLPYLENHTGVSLHELITSGLGVPLTLVSSVDVGFSDGALTGRLSSLSSDLVSPGDAGFPFEDQAQPAFIYDGADLLFAVGRRVVPSNDPPVMTGYLQNTPATPDRSIALLLHLTSTLQDPEVTADPGTAEVDQTVQFHGRVDRVDPNQQLTWSWRIGDRQPFGDGPDPTTTFAAAGHYQVFATVSAPDGSSGTRSVFVDVTGGSTAPPPTSPPPTQADNGTGGPRAPDVGPRQGSGPVVGGVPTARGGSGAPGRSYAPRPSGAAASATASAGPADPAGSVVGYVLSGATAAPVRQTAPRPRDDSAAAARAGTEPVSLPGWLLGVGAAALLAAVGALRERHRPTTTTRPRRKR